ncbi:type IV secretion system DNA-binding domain-containing protein, partial [Akkermansiaceae bacterium]|nr:type IV secretion system DNA-binding domain-containing protein [Akkermansiaceae bacterium]
MRRLLTATSLAGLGVGGFLHLPPPYHWAAAILGAGTGLSALLPTTERKVILRIGPLTWTKEEFCRHFLITGDTGSGKTTSGLNPILLQITQNVPNWGGLVLGSKGTEHHFIGDLLKFHGRSADHVHLKIRPAEASSKWTPPHRFNLLSDRSLSWSTHAKIISDIVASLTEGKQHAFFRPMAQIALANAFELLDVLGKKVTLTRAYELLTTPKATINAIKELRSRGIGNQERELIEFFETTFTGTQSHEQRDGVVGTLQTQLGFLIHPDIAEVFSSDEPNSTSLSALDRGTVFTVEMPQSLATERRYLQTYLKILFYLHVLRRFDKPAEQRRKSNLLLLVGDEFQDLATASEDGFSDHKAADRIREAGACIIAGMQSEISADPVIGEKKRKVLNLNLR